MSSTRTTSPIAALAMLGLLGVVAVAYWPGLAGAFLFDDLINLDALGRYGGVRDAETFLYFLTSGTADPTGRPVAQLSFLIDATNWPADPRPFKRTNLAVHLANGALLFLLVHRLQRWLPLTGGPRATRFVPLLAASLWLAHPLWVSTTLYVIQRQALLATTFTLLGLLAWDCAYRRFRAHRDAKAWAWICFGVGGATVMAGLSKANGFQLPLLALVLWGVVQAPHAETSPPERRNALRRHVALGLGIPAVAFVGYLAYQIPAAIRAAAAFRDWTLGERLLSQPRALWDYIGLLVMPRTGSDGVFTDGFAVSHGFFQPWSTLPALAGLAALAWLAIALRRRWPRFSAGVLFFLAGHLLESGPVPLELYFEHRNYLPALLMGWPLAHALLAVGSAPRARLALAVVLLALWLGLTWQRAEVWGNPPLQAALWAEHNPDSPRAQGYAANWLMRQGRVDEARILLARTEERAPGQVMVALNRIAEGCHSGRLDEAALDAARNAILHLRTWNQGTLDWLEGMQRAVVRGDCPALGRNGWHALFAALAGNQAFLRAPSRRQMLARMEGRDALARGDPDAALHAYDKGLALDPRPELALAQAADLGNAGYEEWGIRHLDRYRTFSGDHPAPGRIRDMRDLHRWVLARTGYYRDELDALRTALGADE